MDFIEGLNQVLDYVENHLKVTDNDEISLEKLAKIAGTSVYHFQRMFAYFADMPLSEYVRRRRLSRAAVDLQNGESVLQVSLKYGYNSPTAFNRAFKNIHGIAPSKVQGKNQVVKSYPPLRFVLSVVGKEPLEFRLEKKSSFRIVGISQKLGTTLEENFSKVPKMWMKASLFGTVKKLQICRIIQKFQVFWELAFQKKIILGLITLLLLLVKMMKSYNQQKSRHLLGQFLAAKVQIVIFRFWKNELLQNGFQLLATNTITAQMWKFIFPQIQKMLCLKFGFQL